MDENRSVAIVGRPNVGKSRLFNRLVRKRVAIVHDEPGVTRDVVAEEVNEDFILMDTGGIGMKSGDMSSREIHEATEDQVDFAIQAAGALLFVVDGLSGLVPLDHEVAAKLRKIGKPVILVVNKIDTREHMAGAENMYKIGFGDPVFISAEHGKGIGELVDRIEQVLGPKPDRPKQAKKDQRIKFCFAGMPNAGKSSLINALLHEKRLIVSEVPGTTRDSVVVDIDYTTEEGKDLKLQLVDTAGLRPKKKIDNVVEYFSGMRTTQAIEHSDVVFFVIDALKGVTKHDKKVAGDAIAAGRGLIIVVNKWDYAIKQFKKEPLSGYDDIEHYKKSFKKAIYAELFFLPKSPVLFVSATEGLDIDQLLKHAGRVYQRLNQKLPTSQVNTIIGNLVEAQKPKIVHGKRLKIYYCVQVGSNPYKIKVFCNQAMRLEEGYKRYLMSGFNNAFKLEGCPIEFEFIGKKKRER